MKTIVSIGIAAAFTLAMGSAADALTLNVTSSGVYDYGVVSLSGYIPGYGAFNGNEYAGPIVLKGTTDGGSPFTAVTFCFDILHSISAGFGYQAPVSYTFSTSTLTSDQTTGPGTGNPLSMSQINNMSGLTSLGASLFIGGASDLTNRMPAIQAAIWSVEYGMTAVMGNPTAQSYYDGYMGMTFNGPQVPVIIAKNAQGVIVGGQQGLGLGAVPEPASWALMIAGFGLVGVSARRRRQAVVTA